MNRFVRICKAVLHNLWIGVLCIPLIMLLLSGTAAAMLSDNTFHVQVTLNGDRQITVEYGTQFYDPGAQAQISGTVLLTSPEQLDVTVVGQVDTAAVGTYVLRYEAEFEKSRDVATRTVRVVDTQPPVITLVTDDDSYTLPGKAYQEEGFCVVDGYDGDITSRVHRKEHNGVVTYTVSDSAGNIAQATRQIVYDDRNAPELILTGEQSIRISKGTSFTDPGCIARDDCLGDISDRISVTGSVDCDRVGSYVLTYRAEDDYGNTAEIQRTVHVVNPQGYGKVIYLTFDDGPSGYTNGLLNVLKKYVVKATFFLVNTGCISTAKRIVNEGHAVGIHSISHNYKTIYANEEAYLKDLYGMQEIIRQQTGVTTYLMRFPGGSSNTVSRPNPGLMTRLTKLVEEKGFRYFDWNVSSSDTSAGISSEQIYQNVIKGISRTSKSVVLQHDIYKNSVDAVEKIIQWGLENGYTFAALDYNSPGAHHRVNN